MTRQLLGACLSDLRYDTQAEESRGDWLWQMIRAVDAVERFRVPFCMRCTIWPMSGAANQLCELASHFARTGDDTFRMRLYEIVEKKPIDDCPWLAEKRSSSWTAKRASSEPQGQAEAAHEP